MSADNGIYILVTKKPGSDTEKEYRVAHAQAIENIDYGTDEDKMNSLVQYFGGPRVGYFDNRIDAIVYAHNTAQSYSVLEYGVQEIDYSFMEFPDTPYEQACAYWRNK